MSTMDKIVGVAGAVGFVFFGSIGCFKLGMKAAEITTLNPTESVKVITFAKKHKFVTYEKVYRDGVLSKTVLYADDGDVAQTYTNEGVTKILGK